MAFLLRTLGKLAIVSDEEATARLRMLCAMGLSMSLNPTPLAMSEMHPSFLGTPTTWRQRSSMREVGLLFLRLRLPVMSGKQQAASVRGGE